MTILDQLDFAVSRIRPVCYIVIYLAAIPAFAALYTFITPHGFYAPYAQFEPAAVSDTLSLQFALANPLRRSIKSHKEDERVIGDVTFFDVVSVSDIKPTGDREFSFTLFMGGRSDKGKNTFESTGGLGCTVRVSRVKFWSATYPTVFRVIYAPTEVSGDPELSDEQRQSALGLALWNSDMKRYGLILSDEEDSKVENYISAISGDPYGVSGSYYRMIYLSAVVITTLGLGDIVPISGSARILVASEAIGGIVIAGLFLNALAYRAARTKP